MAGTGKSDYEEWKLFAFPAKRTPQGVAMIVLFLIWALYDILSLPVISNPLPVCSRTTAANFCHNLQFKMILIITLPQLPVHRLRVAGCANSGQPRLF
jgi:hypothetical protein